MPCLFGDATNSELEIDYLLLVRDVFDFAVEVLLASGRIDDLKAAMRSADQAAEIEKARLEAMHRRLTEALGPDADGPDGPASRCAEAISRACRGAVDDEIRRLDVELARERDLSEKTARRERKQVERALEKLLLVPHPLPASDSELELVLSGELGYSATLRARSSYGVEVLLDYDIPEHNLFAAPVRVLQLSPSMEIHVPEERGWISKKIKPVRHKLGKHFIAGLRHGPSRIVLSLREEAAIGAAGFDLMLDADWPAPRVVPVAAGVEADLADAHQLDSDDEAVVRELLTTLVDAADAVRPHPSQLLEARLDGAPLVDADEVTTVVDRLLELMAPTVREIATHSPQDGELVLKRNLGGDRREEIYVSVEELLAKLEPLTPEQRECFRPLGILGGRPPSRQTIPAPVPPPTPSEPRSPVSETEPTRPEAKPTARPPEAKPARAAHPPARRDPAARPAKPPVAVLPARPPGAANPRGTGASKAVGRPDGKPPRRMARPSQPPASGPPQRPAPQLPSVIVEDDEPTAVAPVPGVRLPRAESEPAHN